ncbi:TetR/AcrR family transcriptional regulator [Occultella kanbiaonis]|uniref:TetR/AcrR family transcriptional regulator n=1 Tax=Occultella kanbiaonis TaxID=2675754 RepID=UPI0012B887BE|nr:TetR/AcrR family transcriptional regulator [Occultella kanbiaonis]
MPNERDTGRTRNPRGEGGRLREEILAAAAGLLNETGDSRAVTLRAVARSVGIAAPSIYRHFDGQPAMMLAVVEQDFAALEQSLRAAVDAAGAEPRAQLVAGCQAYLTFAVEHPGSYRAMFGGEWIPELDETITEDRLRSLGDGSMAVIREALGRCVQDGTSSSDSPADDAVALWLGLHGIAHQRASTRIFIGPDGIEDRMIGALAHLV